MIYTVDDEQYYHIQDFATYTNLSNQAVRYLCFNGNAIRKLQYIYVRSRLYIKASELEEFPFIKGGHKHGLHNIYHYKLNEEGKWERYLCVSCTAGRSYDHNENMLNMPTLEPEVMGQMALA